MTAFHVTQSFLPDQQNIHADITLLINLDC